MKQNSEDSSLPPEHELFTPAADEASAASHEAADDDSVGDDLSNRRSPTFRALQELIAGHVNSPNYKPVKPKILVKQLQLPAEQERAVKKAVKFLVKEGRLSYGTNHLVHPLMPKSNAKGKDKAARPASAPYVRSEAPTETTPSVTVTRRGGNRDAVTGIFRRTSSGAGYVRPSGTPRSRGRELDILIPRTHTHDAADGDKVLVRLSRDRSGRPDGRVSGEVIEIVERDTNRFVGVYDEDRGNGYVAIDGRVFAAPIFVGDASAKAAQPGDKVVVEMVRFPTHAHEGEGVIVEILGARGAPGVDTLSIIREFELPGDFPDDVLADARNQAAKFDESLEGRVDYTNETVITIDPVDARDFDDAISLRRLDNGHWQLAAHIADVSHFVPEKSALDREARDRATSVYLPDRVIPMLPEIISNHLASLQPDRVRYTQTCLMEFSAEGVPLHAEVQRAAIRSKRRFAYEEVDDFLADKQSWRSKLTPEVWQLLDRMHDFAMILRNRRMEQGAIELTLPEVKIDLDKQGRVSGAHLVQNTVSHQIIEEFMLAANEATARLLAAQKLNFLRRIHESPDLRKLNVLTGFVKELGVECGSLESRFEIKRVVAAVAGTPLEHAVNYAILRSMQKAVYSPMVEGHYALHSENYCHFTSPIRRYPDLTIHRMFNALAAGQRPPDELGKQTLLAEHCSEREQRAEKAERELVKVKLLDHLSHQIGARMEAVVTGVEEFGLFAQGSELPAEGLIRVQTLGDDYFHFDRDTHSLVGRRGGNAFRLGDLLSVEIAHVDVDRRELDFKLISKLHAAAPTPRGRRRGDDSRRDEKRGKNRKPSKPTRSAAPKFTPQPITFGPDDKPRRKKKQRPGKRERQERKKGKGE